MRSSWLTSSFKRWRARLPDYARCMVDAWIDCINGLAIARGLGDASLARLRRECVDDVTAQLDLLAVGASKRVLAAWASWYPEWVSARLRELEELEPDVFMTEDERRAAQSQRDSLLAQQRQQMRRDVALGEKLLAMLREAPGGVIRWEPDKVARVLAGRGPVPRVKPMADALVRLGVATWDRTPSGKPWALALLHSEVHTEQEQTCIT